MAEKQESGTATDADFIQKILSMSCDEISDWWRSVGDGPKKEAFIVLRNWLNSQLLARFRYGIGIIVIYYNKL
jgi:hypothetical protein